MGAVVAPEPVVAPAVVPAVPDAAAVPSTPVAPETPVIPAAPATEPAAIAPPVPPVVPVVPAAPVAYDFKLPDGVAADSVLVERTTAAARALGLSNEMAQTLLDRDIKVTADLDAAQKASYDDAVKAWSEGGTEFVKRDTAWKAEALADPDLGAGDPAKLALAEEKGAQALARFAPEVIPILKATGYASHPAILKAFARIGNAMSDGKTVLGIPVAPAKTLAYGLYENDGKGPAPKPVAPTT